MTPEETYKKNLALIDRKNPELAKNLDNLPITGLRLSPGPNGYLIGQIWDLNNRQWVAMCDPNDPVSEALLDIEGKREGSAPLYSADNKVYSLLGMGCGYFAVEFAKKLKPYQRFSIFDVDPNCYKACMYCVDMEPLLGNARVDTFIGDNLAQSLQHWWLTLNSHEKFHIAAPMRAGYTQGIYPDVYDSLMLLSMDMMRYHAVGLATWRQFGPHIGDNDFGNMPDFLINPGMDELKDKWKGKPAFCLAAGPSLKKNLYKLINSPLRDRFAVITVGTVYALLQGLQFEPDLITTIDFQRLNFTDQFQNIPLNDRVPLLYLHSTHPETPRRWPGPKYVALNSSDTTEWMRHFTRTPKMAASQVQTVAHLSFLAAIVAGASPIILMGQDLAMPHDEHHAPGARAQDTAPKENEDAHVRAEDIYGNDCWTRHSFLSMRTVFQQIIQNNPGPQYLNATEGGIHIEGTENISVDQALGWIEENVEPSEERLGRKLGHIWKGYENDTKWDEMILAFKKLQGDVKKIVDNAKSIQSLARNRRKELKRGAEGESKAKSLAERIKKKEEPFQQLQAAFSLFAVRRFDMVELLSRIPPPDGTSVEELDNCQIDKLVTLSDQILDESAIVQRLLRMTWNRIEDVLPKSRKDATLEDIVKMMSRQSYSPASQLLNNGRIPRDAGDTPAEQMAGLVRVKAQLYKHRQQYAEAAALLNAWDMAPKTVGKMHKIIEDNTNILRPIVPQYYLLPESEPIPTPVVVDQTGQQIELVPREESENT
jgi:hypothetical protein